MSHWDNRSTLWKRLAVTIYKKKKKKSTSDNQLTLLIITIFICRTSMYLFIIILYKLGGITYIFSLQMFCRVWSMVLTKLKE